MDSDDHDLSTNRRSSLAISALLNEDSIDPLALPTTKRLTPEEKRENRKTWHGFATEETPKAKRKRISTQQLNRLMDTFQQTDTPSSEVRERLAEELGMTKREVQVWFQNRRAKASRARAVAATTSHSSHNGPPPSSTAQTRYDPFTRPDHRSRYSANMMAPPLPQPLPTKNCHYHSPQPQPSITFTPPPSRRASSAFPDSSSMSPTHSSTSLQPIAPMPPSITIPPPFTAAYTKPVPPTPPYLQPIAPRNHGNQRPKSFIDVLNTTL